jgi:hypothetical protein
MKRILLIFLGLVSAAATPIFGQVIPRSYELQCSFTNGSRLVLKQNYTWDAFAAMLPRDVTTTEYIDHQIRFIDKSGKKSDWLRQSGQFGGEIPKDLTGAQRVCSNVSMINDKFSYGVNYLDEKLLWKEAVNSWPDKFYLSKVSDQQPETVRDHLTTRQLSPSTVKTVVLGKRVIYEQALRDLSPLGERKDGNLTIAAVYQSESLDEGKTWSDPIVTTSAKIFELGKSLDAQSFVGFPYSFNGKRFNEQRPVK